MKFWSVGNTMSYDSIVYAGSKKYLFLSRYLEYRFVKYPS
jgi:hypothetical protein